MEIHRAIGIHGRRKFGEEIMGKQERFQGPSGNAPNRTEVEQDRKHSDRMQQWRLSPLIIA